MKIISLLFVVVAACSATAQVSLPSGKGIWIYHLAETGRPALVAKGIRNAGFDYVVVKIHEGSELKVVPECFKTFGIEFKKQNLKVYIWGYNYARNDQETRLIEHWLTSPYVDGYVFDGEEGVVIRGNRKNRSKRSLQVSQLVETVIDCRNRLAPTKSVGWSTFGFYNHHTDLPVREFVDGGIDYISPQVYWADTEQSPQRAVDESVNQWRSILATTGKNLPLVLTGQTYQHSYRELKPGDVGKFTQEAQNLKVLAVDFYRYPEGRKDKDALPGYDAYLAEANGGQNFLGNNVPMTSADRRSVWWLVSLLILVPLFLYLRRRRRVRPG